MRDRDKIASTAACVLTVVLLIVGTRRHIPYGFYTLLRIAVCGLAAYFAWRDWKVPTRIWPLAFAAIAVLFNPLMPIRLSRADWYPIDVAVAGLFALWAVLDWNRANT
jgi:hypothetical protein